MIYTDIHTHHTITKPNVIAIRNISIAEADAMIHLNENGWFSIGIHPWNADSYQTSEVFLLENLAKNDRIKFIGECGLDKNSKAGLELQLFFLIKQIEISEQLQKPLIIHCVGYYNELFDLKKRHNPTVRWIIHGFRGKPQLAEQALKEGFDLSFGERFNEQSVRITPLENLFVETDESLLSIEQIYEKTAFAKHCNIEDLNAGEKLLNC